MSYCTYCEAQTKLRIRELKEALKGVLKQHSERELDESKPGRRIFWDCSCAACETARKTLGK